jgi:hypothetical protein
MNGFHVLERSYSGFAKCPAARIGFFEPGFVYVYMGGDLVLLSTVSIRGINVDVVHGKNRTFGSCFVSLKKNKFDKGKRTGINKAYFCMLFVQVHLYTTLIWYWLWPCFLSQSQRHVYVTRSGKFSFLLHVNAYTNEPTTSQACKAEMFLHECVYVLWILCTCVCVLLASEKYKMVSHKYHTLGN